MSCPCDRGRPLGRSLTWLCTESSCLRARLDDGGCKVDPYGNGGAGALRSSRGPWRPGGSYSARRLVPGYFRAHGRLARALQLMSCELSYVVACYESEGSEQTDLLNAKPSQVPRNWVGSRHSNWLRGLERREGRLPLSSGPRASSPAPAGRGAAAGVYHTPEGSPPGGLSGPGAWVLHMPAVGLVVDGRGRMKQLVLGYPWEAASRCSCTTCCSQKDSGMVKALDSWERRLEMGILSSRLMCAGGQDGCL